MNFNGYVNLKKLSYGKDHWKGAAWIGGVEDDFSRAKEHAEKSMGNNPMRIYVFVCGCLKKVVRAKQEIRAVFNIGNHSVHINDSKKEALQLAQTYFNHNSLQIIQARPYSTPTEKLDKFIDEMKKHCARNRIDLSEVCAAGSTPLAAVGLRESSDFDFLYCGKKKLPDKGKYLSNHKSQLKYYPFNETEIIQNPANHFYYRGMKFISLDILKKMKSNRDEVPKDVCDCLLIDNFLSGLPVPVATRKKPGFKLFRKVKNGAERTIHILGFIKFSYKKGKK